MVHEDSATSSSESSSTSDNDKHSDETEVKVSTYASAIQHYRITNLIGLKSSATIDKRAMPEHRKLKTARVRISSDDSEDNLVGPSNASNTRTADGPEVRPKTAFIRRKGRSCKSHRVQTAGSSNRDMPRLSSTAVNSRIARRDDSYYGLYKSSDSTFSEVPDVVRTRPKTAFPIDRRILDSTSTSSGQSTVYDVEIGQASYKQDVGEGDFQVSLSAMEHNSGSESEDILEEVHFVTQADDLTKLNTNIPCTSNDVDYNSYYGDDECERLDVKQLFHSRSPPRGRGEQYGRLVS